MRDVFLALSKNATVRQLVVGFPPSRLVSRRFVAGETLDETIGVVRKLNGQGLRVTIDVLGESVTSEAEARAAKDAYLRTLDAIASNGVKSNVSVKLTQMGLALSPDLCLDNMRQIVGRAKEVGAFTRIDMEDSPYTQSTLNIFKTLREEFDNVGIVIQAYLYRSEEDMQQLRAMGADVRLCKGAYKEPAEIAFPLKRDVDANYVKLAEAYLKPNGQENGAFLALATHDEKMIHWAKGYAAANKLDQRQFEFQMLYGIRPGLQKQLIAEGYQVRIYVPYGTHWYPYFMRRLAERPANVIFLVSNLFRG
ncbi:MAG: proline dehydrogenase family protein [Anaerolineae bacterium]